MKGMGPSYIFRDWTDKECFVFFIDGETIVGVSVINFNACSAFEFQVK